VTVQDSEQLRVIFLCYGLVEEAGGPGIAATGYAAGLAALGVDVIVVALGAGKGTWLIDEDGARAHGYSLLKLPDRSLVTNLASMLRVVLRLPRGATPQTVIWANGIWGVQSLSAAAISRRRRWPYVIRPAGSLGLAALRHRRLKKLAYYTGVESHILRGAAAIHCMSVLERSELPEVLQPKAFIVPSAVDLPTTRAWGRTSGRPVLGVLARIHRIKRHDAALDVVEALDREGVEVELEFAGSVDDAAFERTLRGRVEASPLLRERVRFLGHVAREKVPEVVGRWRVALLLSQQENFGHAVIAAAAAGTPTVASMGVGVAAGLERAGAGLQVPAAESAWAIRQILGRDPDKVAVNCIAFASTFSEQACSTALLRELRTAAVSDRAQWN
jgi:glycosyltransferase involved in cell wall biosynthesis